jgi:hypothetical protein
MQLSPSSSPSHPSNQGRSVVVIGAKNVLREHARSPANRLAASSAIVHSMMKAVSEPHD